MTINISSSLIQLIDDFSVINHFDKSKDSCYNVIKFATQSESLRGRLIETSSRLKIFRFFLFVYFSSFDFLRISIWKYTLDGWKLTKWDIKLIAFEFCGQKRVYKTKLKERYRKKKTWEIQYKPNKCDKTKTPNDVYNLSIDHKKWKNK